MKPSVAIDLHLFLLAEGREDVLLARPSARTVVLAAGLWDLLDVGACWGVGGRHLTVVRSLPEEWAPLRALYDVMQPLGTARPLTIWRAFFASVAVDSQGLQWGTFPPPPGFGKALSPADQLAQDVVSYLRQYQNVSAEGFAVPSAIADVLVQRVRRAALGPYVNPTDGALLLALNRCTFLRDRYFFGRSEKLALRNRVRDILKQPPRAGGWTMDGLLKSLYLYDQRPFGYLD